ncbi:MAG: transcriptional regulator, family [Chloroflexi bacterium]|jgi:DNA-binding XRE family transcriptional regulator|nr:transcriptional regulator, family [Chloroflexota bacterium]
MANPTKPIPKRYQKNSNQPALFAENSAARPSGEADQAPEQPEMPAPAAGAALPAPPPRVLPPNLFLPEESTGREWNSEELAALAMEWAKLLKSKDTQTRTKDLEELGAKISNLVVLPETYDDESNLTVLSHAIYQALRDALAQNNFQRTDDSPWPTAILKKGGATGHAQLIPPIIENAPLMPTEQVDAWAQMMWEQQKDLTDLDADALDLLSHIWLQQAKTAKDYAIAHVDQFLSMRGLEQKQKEKGRRGGYEPEQRARMLQVLSHIQNVWLNLGEIEIYEQDPRRKGRSKATRQTFQSRAFIITDRMGQMRLDGYLDVERFIFQPGHLFAHFLFGPGRQTALLSARAVQYDPYRQRVEKRLARYLSWQWRIQAKQGEYSRPYRVSTLLEAVGEELNERRPSATRDRLEKALDTLQQDGVISSWQYDRWDESVVQQRGWAQVWVQATLLLEPPQVIRDTYKGLERHKKDKDRDGDDYLELKEAKTPVRHDSQPVITVNAEPEAVQPPPADENLGRRIKQHRKKLKLSQTEAAEQLGIVQSYLSKIEKNHLRPALDLQQRILEWLEQAPSR